MKKSRSVLQHGFTLIELLTTITIMAVLSTIGVTSFVTFNRLQELNTASQNVVTALQLAKASASSQVKPSSCLGALTGYQVSVELNPRADGLEYYALAPLCDGIVDVAAQQAQPLSKNVTFDPTSDTTIEFHTVRGDASAGRIILKHSQMGIQNTKTITVTTDGRIQVQ